MPTRRQPLTRTPFHTRPPCRAVAPPRVLGFAAPVPVLVLALALALVAALGCRAGAERRLTEARQALAADRHDEAARLFREAAMSDPSGPFAATAELELARIQYLHLRDVQAARDRLLRLVKDHGDNHTELDRGLVRSARELLASIYARELNEPARALEHYRLLVESEADPDVQRSHLLALADCYYRLDRLPEARMTYRRALEAPYATEADASFLRLARLEYSLGNTDIALEWLEALAEHTADLRTRHEAVASAIEMLIDAGRFNDARARLADAKVSFPESEELDAFSGELQDADETSDPREAADAALATLQERLGWGGGRRTRTQGKTSRVRQP